MADGTGESLLPNSTLSVAYPDGIANVYAQWEKTEYEYTIIFEDGEGNQIASESFKAEDPYTITVKDYEHQAIDGVPADRELLGWAKKEAKTAIVETLTYDSDHMVWTVVPVYKEFVWTVTWVDEDASLPKYGTKKTSSYEKSKYFDKTFPVAKPTKDGYKFLRWELDGKEVKDVVNTILLTSDKLEVTIVAKWEKIEDPNTVTTPGYGHGTFN
ncbi:MAG: hypothetical protein HDS38_00620 [Bacteroides sp.]|nr:hypothetical protein [Bacteroides sp.]